MAAGVAVAAMGVVAAEVVEAEAEAVVAVEAAEAEAVVAADVTRQTVPPVPPTSVSVPVCTATRAWRIPLP